MFSIYSNISVLTYNFDVNAKIFLKICSKYDEFKLSKNAILIYYITTRSKRERTA